jgi:hypothetical protein
MVIKSTKSLNFVFFRVSITINSLLLRYWTTTFSTTVEHAWGNVDWWHWTSILNIAYTSWSSAANLFLATWKIPQPRRHNLSGWHEAITAGSPSQIQLAMAPSFFKVEFGGWGVYRPQSNASGLMACLDFDSSQGTLSFAGTASLMGLLFLYLLIYSNLKSTWLLE